MISAVRRGLSAALGVAHPASVRSEAESRINGFDELCTGQLRCVGMDLANRFSDLLHICSRAEQHGLREPDGFLAELIVSRTLGAVLPFLESLLREEALESA